MKPTTELRITASKRDRKGLDVREVPLLPRREKCFLLTSLFIGPAIFRPTPSPESAIRVGASLPSPMGDLENK